MVGKKLVSQTFVYGIASLLINGSNFFLIPFYTHYLSTAEYGIISSVILFSTFTTSFMGFGLNGAVTRFYFDYEANDFKKFLFTIFALQTLVSFLIAFSFTFFNGLFLNSLFNNVPYDPFLKYGIWIGFAGVFAALPLALLQVKSKALLYRAFTTASFIALTSLMIYFVVIKKEGSIGGVKASLFANIIMAVLYSIYVLRNSKFNFNPAYARIALLFSLPLMVYAIFGTLTEVSSKYFIEKFVSLSELGVYNVAQQFSAIILLLVNAINMAWTPIFYATAKVNESSELFRSFGKLFIFSLALFGLSLSLFSDEIVLLLMPSSYYEAAKYMPILILAYIIGNGFWILLINPLTFSKKTVYLPILTVFSGSISIVLNVILIPKFGALGAAFSTLATYFVLIAAAYFPFRKFSKVNYNIQSMTWMVLIAIILYVTSTFITFNSLTLTIIFKLVVLAFFLLSLMQLKIYSIAEIKNFFKSHFDII
ncbi:MAG: oligosaccharide flippase family protein [Cyclobacteriaceae bacterium]